MKPKELVLLSSQVEKLNAASLDREACQACGLFEFCQTPFMKPYVPRNWTGKLLAIGEAPGKHEDEESGRQFTGAAGNLLRGYLEEGGYDGQDVAFVNACRCRPPKNKTPSMKQIRACRPFLLRTIDYLCPDKIIVFGSTALKAIKNSGSDVNIAENRGRPIEVVDLPKYEALATYHPASVLHGNIQHADRIREDLVREDLKHLDWPDDGIDPEGQHLGFDTEFLEPGPDLDPPIKKREVYCVALADDVRARAYLPNARKLKTLFKQARKLMPHNGPVDVDSIVQLGLCKETWAKGLDIRDSLWLARLADENRGKGGYKLENLLTSVYDVKGWKHKTEEYGYDPRKWPPNLMHERCRLDAWASLHLSDYYLDKARGQLTFQHRIAMTLQRIYHAGSYIDYPAYQVYTQEKEAALLKSEKKLKRKAKQLGLTEFVPTNKNHYRDYLYEGLGITPTSFTKDGLPKADKQTLKQFVGEYPEIQVLMDYARDDKIHSTYVEGLARLMQLVGRGKYWIPVRINPLGARTLRRSSGADPFEQESDEPGLNFQNWTKDVKHLITSRFKDGVVADQDYQKLEAILQGWLAGEEQMVDFFVNSPNGYIEIGKKLFGKEVKKDSKEYTQTKSTCLAVNYNLNPWGLAKRLWDVQDVKLATTWDGHLAETEAVYQKYFRLFPRLKRYIQECIHEAYTTGKVVMTLGYERRLPCPEEPPKSEKEEWKAWNKIRKHIANEACNCKAQHLASLVTGSAMIDTEERLLHEYNLTYVDYHRMLMEKKWPMMPILMNEVHDDLVYDIPKPHRKRDLQLIKEAMEELPTLRGLMPELPHILKTEQSYGPRWGQEL